MAATIIIVAILVVVAIYAIRSSAKHFSGKGGCCGGGDDVKVQKKKLDGPVVEKKLVHIEGMTCDNCRKRVENELNDLDGVLAKVNLKKKTATVQLSKPVDDAELRKAVEHVHYEVTGIEAIA